MAAKNRMLPIALTLALAVGLQVIFGFADAQDTPYRAVREFSKTFFSLDTAMQGRLSDAFEPRDAVDEYVYHAFREAESRGFSLFYLKGYLKDSHMELLQQTDQQAVIRLTGERRYYLRSLFTGETLPVDTILTLVKEDGQWKIAATDMFALPL